MTEKPLDTLVSDMLYLVIMTIQEVLRFLEIPLDHTVASLLQSPNQQDLTKFKLKIRKQRRKLAMKYHPDLAKQGAEHLNLKRMQTINQLCDMLLASRVVYRLPPQPQYHYTVHVYRSNNAYGSSTDSSTTTYGGFY